MFRTVLLFTLPLLCESAIGQQKNPFRDTVQAIDKIFTHYSTATPGLAIRISRNGTVLYEKAFGMADLEHHVINTPATIFEAGSVSKQFTAAAALLLIQEGKLAFQDDIRKYFPDLPDYGHVITVEHLFHHTSGLRDWGGIAEIQGWPRGTRIYTPAHVKEIIWKQRNLNFIPGSEYNYSNSNYNLLVFLVEKISGQSLQQFTSERLFKPMGMKNTQWRDNFREIIPNRAFAYSGSPGAYQLNMPIENTFGHGALLTTVADLDVWNQRWNNNLLGPEINALQKTRTKLNNGKEINYARGVVVDNFNDLETISHSGATAGYRAWLVYFPENKLSIAILSNYARSNVVELGNKAAELFLGKEEEQKRPNLIPVNVDMKKFSGKEGIYKNIRNEETQEFIFKNDSLRLSWGFGLLPMSDNTVYHPEGFVFSFSGSGAGIKMFLTNPGGDTATYYKVNRFSPTEEILKSFTGNYFSEEADVMFKLFLKDGKLQYYSPDSYHVLEPAFTDAFYEDHSILYHFFRNKKKEIKGFLLSSGRVRNLKFIKVK